MTDPLKPGINIARAITPRIPELPRSLTRPGGDAGWMHERVVRSIAKFEEELDADKGIGLRLINTPGNEVIHIDDVGYWGPDLIIFYGKNKSGEPVEVLQHYSQVSLMLVAAQKQGQEPKRIGFLLLEKLDKNASE